MLLTWQTANEINVSHINIQRAINNNEFTTIGNVNASCCAYSYTDNSPLSTVNGGLSTIYYRLEIVDKDGSKTYSEVKNVELGIRNLGVSIYPNPVLLDSRITISCKGMREVRVVNQLGQVVYWEIASGTNLRNDATTINTKQLPKGIYVVQVITIKGTIETAKFVKE